MSIRTRVQTLLLAVTLVIATVATYVAGAPQQPQAPAIPAAALAQAMPADPQITMGKFPNGLSYYIRSNPKPEKRAELRLVIKAGSVLENDDQQGLAHFLEHMAFDGTAHFPKKDIESFIESLGMRFGADLNASTGFDETTYMLTLPSDKLDVMDKAFLIMEDWAHNVTLDPAEVDKERAVVMEEWRLRRGAGARMTDKMFPILLKGSKYADRIPIGKTEIIQNAPAAQLKKFYTDWYRPDLMAVIAVGDFDKAAIQNMIQAHFAGIPAAVNPQPRPVYDIPDHPGTMYAILTDKETTSASIEVDNLMPARKQGTLGVYRQEMVDSLFAGMLSNRYSELTQKPDAPFIDAGADRSMFLIRTKEDASLSALVKENGIERGLDGLLTEAERVTKFGFTASELDREKQESLRGYERQAAEANTRVSASRAAEYIRNFVQNENLTSAEDEYALHQRLLPTITLDEVNKLAKEWFPDQNRLVIVTAPEKAGLVIPDEAKLAAVFKSAPAKTLTAYVDSVGTATLLDAIPTPGAVAATSTKDALGITEWTLSNGVKVVLKPTTFKEDEIVFRATSFGGTSLASDKDYIPASSATQVISAGGLGKFNDIDLRKVLSGKIAGANPSIGELTEGLSGSSSKKDLETMFQLIYMRFTQPRADETAFGAQASQMKDILANQAASPDYAYSVALNKSLYGDHIRRQPTTPATIDGWDLYKSLAFYKDRFANAGDFTFVFVGSFDLATMKPLVERYLGSLPSIKRQETWKDVGARLPAGVVENKVEKGIEPKSTATIVFHGPFVYDDTHRVAIDAMSHVLQTRLLQTIREELGGTYSITASDSYQKIPVPEYTIAVRFGADPQKMDDMIKRVMQEIEAFKKDGPTEKQLSDEKSALLRGFETASKQNAYLMGQIANKYLYGEDVASIWDAPTAYGKLDAASIQQAAKTYLDTNNRVQVTLFPEKK